ncbi:MAG TPA: CRISPR-associated endonuclease Cas2 [Allocoleopsis sp.]
MKIKEDSVRFYPLSRQMWGQVKTWGVGTDMTQAPGSVVI